MKVQLFPHVSGRPGALALEASALDGAREAGLVVQSGRIEHSPDVALVIYGAGSPERTAIMKAHRQAGGRVVCMDGGYFGRRLPANGDYFRVAIDELHARPEYIEATPDDGSRWDRFGIELRDDFDPKGPVIVVGMGPKSRAGLGLTDWEQRTLKRAAARFPKHRIIYRRKDGRRGPKPDGVAWPDIDGATPIPQLLRGASLVIARHSNVSVDACIAGVPVECEDGAARWLYRDGPIQPAERRASFLRRLAWWNWQPREMGEAWNFLMRMMREHS